ncbi:MAG TPA: PIG-L family deacetylase [Bryobacteraceae bacterium]|nr:PIG-L family deacetylase [Bryobacteraceae bacterium]
MKKHILAIHAHPDDVEILAAGTLAQLTRAGHAVTIVTMTPGDCGSSDHPPEEIAAIRRKEAARSAARIGADYRCAEFRDLSIFNDDASRRRVVEILRQVAPELVLTSSPIDYLCDHEATSQLVRDACFAAPAPNYATGANPAASPLHAIPHLYFMDPISGVDRDGCRVLPDFFVKVGSEMDVKTAMLAEHASQRTWLLKHHGVDNYLDAMRDWSQQNGKLAGVDFAEGFRHYKGHPYPQSPFLEELLGATVLARRTS